MLNVPSIPKLFHIPSHHPSLHCPHLNNVYACNNRLLLFIFIFMIRRSFQDLSKSAFINLYRALVRPHLECGMPACLPKRVADVNHLERIQRIQTGMRHLPYEERLQRRRLRVDLIAAFTIFKGLLNIDPNSIFLPPARRGLRGHPYKALQGVGHRRSTGCAFSVRVVKYWNQLPSSVVTAPSVNVFKKRLEKVRTGVSPYLTIPLS